MVVCLLLAVNFRVARGMEVARCQGFFPIGRARGNIRADTATVCTPACPAKECRSLCDVRSKIAGRTKKSGAFELGTT